MLKSQISFQYDLSFQIHLGNVVLKENQILLMELEKTLKTFNQNTQARQAWRQFRIEQCKKLGIPVCLSPFVCVTKNKSFTLSVKDPKAVIELCNLIIQKKEDFLQLVQSNSSITRSPQRKPSGTHLRVCAWLGIPAFLAPFVQLTASNIMFKVKDRETLFSLCQLIIENQHDLHTTKS